jgi:SEC-C motif-containing protein
LGLVCLLAAVHTTVVVPLQKECDALMTLVPRPSAPAVKRLCAQVAPGAIPEYVACEYDESAGCLNCFIDVEARVEKSGGTVQYGWRIWLLPAILVEAEFHSVWRSPSGKLIDVSTPPDVASRILFAPDTVRAYEGRQVNNIRMPLGDDPRIAEFIRLYDRIFEEENRGELAKQHGAVQITPVLHQLLQKQQKLGRDLKALSEKALFERVGRNDSCPCGSGLKFKRCCRPG